MRGIGYVAAALLGHGALAMKVQRTSGVPDIVAGPTSLGSKSRSQHLRDLATYAVTIAGSETSGGNLTAVLKATLAKFVEAADEDCNVCSQGKPGEQDWLFVLSGERSSRGSSPARSAINAIPGHFIGPESRGVMRTLKQLYDTGKDINGRQEKSDPAWAANPISEAKLLCSLQLFAKTFAVGDFDAERTKVIGFQERLAVTTDVGSFFDIAFPCARYVISTEQNVEGAAVLQQSEVAQSIESQVDSWTQVHAGRTFVIKDNVSVEVCNSMLAWLNVQDCHFNEVAQSSSNTESEDTESARFGLQGQMRLSGECGLHH